MPSANKGNDKGRVLAELFIHHFDASPFAEKVRLALGVKALPWYSVEIPMVMPKPNLTCLTGGYRKTPVLQIEAEVYCDTSLILRELENRYPTPSLFPYQGAGLTMATSRWSDTTFFEPGAGLSMGLNEEIPEPILDDRKAFFNFMDFSKLKVDVPHMYAQFLAQVELLDEQLSDGREFMAGNVVSATDIFAYFPLWMARGNFPAVATWLDHYSRVNAWEQRMQAIGHGERQDISPERALDVARAAEPAPGTGVAERDPSDLSAGQAVTVTPTDYGNVPVAGTLIAMDLQRITIRRTDEKVGEVNVHFPRSGYRVDPA